MTYQADTFNGGPVDFENPRFKGPNKREHLVYHVRDTCKSVFNNHTGELFKK